MNITRSVKNALRPLRDIIFSIFGFLYDFRRFYRFGGWRASRNDLRLRRLVDIKQEHPVIMMLAVGLPREEIKVCASERRPLTEVYTRLEE